jgi:hypothetical protein
VGEELALNFKIYVLAEIVSICLLVWFSSTLVRISELEETPIVSDTVDFTNAASGVQNSFLTVDVAQNDKFVKFQTTQGNPTVTLCPAGDSDTSDCAQTDTDPVDMKGIDTTDSTVWIVQPGSYTLDILDNSNEVVSYNLSVLHQPGASTLLRIGVEAAICGVASIGFGWIILKEKKKRRLQGL